MRKKPAQSYPASLLLTLVVIAGIVLFGSFRFYRAYTVRQWHEDTEFRVLDTASLSFTLYTPRKELIRTYLLPSDAYIDVPHGYGFYKIKDIMALSSVEGKGEELMLTAVSNAFGIPFDATKKTLTEWDRLLLWYARALYRANIETYTLSDKPIFTVETRLDGVEVQKVDPLKADRYFKHDLFERAIIDESLTVGVFNSSMEPNVALTLSRKLEKIGVHVIEIDNLSDEDVSRCELRAMPEIQGTYTLRRLMGLFSCTLSVTPPPARFDIVVIAEEIL